MSDQQQSRADALTELRNIAEAKRFDRTYFDDDTSFADWAQNRARHTIAKLSIEQPAAAPTDVGVDCLEKLRALMVRLGLATNESLEGFGAALDDNLYRTIRAVGALVDAAAIPAPSPADERAAFEKWWMDGSYGFRKCDIFESNDVTEDNALEIFREGWQAHASSANETGAEGAAIPAGYAFAPIEPTTEMLEACKQETWIGGNYASRAWKAMIAAAPQPQVKSDGEQS